jgi:pimeloyl-ACP methyl ester carboxylesterase
MAPRIVLLPGLDGTGIGFRAIQSRLAPLETTVVRYPDKSSGYHDDLEVARAHLPGSGPYVLLAESYSGPIAVWLAAMKLPGLVGLVLSATFLECPRPYLGRLSFVLKALPPVRMPSVLLAPLLLNGRSTPEMRRMLNTVLSAASPRSMRNRLLDVASVDVTADSRLVEVPTLYLRAKADRLVPRAAGEGVRRHLRQVAVVDLAGPHLLLQASAEDAAREIARFCGDPVVS